MFDNLGTALVQAIGFFAVFGFFIYQTLFAEKKLSNTQIKYGNKKNSSTNNSNKKIPRKGIFNNKKQSEVELESPKKSGLFNRKANILEKEDKPTKKGWFR